MCVSTFFRYTLATGTHRNVHSRDQASSLPIELYPGSKWETSYNAYIPSRSAMSGKEEQHALETDKRSFCAINTKLIPLKLLIFLFHGGMASLYPFLTIHMKSLGLTITETAVVYALLPVLSFIGPAVAGWTADRLGNYKVILVGAIIFNIFLHTLLYFGVPEFSITAVEETFVTRSVSISLPCNSSQTDLSQPWKSVDFLNFPEADDLQCINTTYANQTGNIINFLLPSTCQSNCRTSHDISGNSVVCLRDHGCVPVADLFSIHGVTNLTVENSTMNSIVVAECRHMSETVCSVNCSLAESLSVSCFQEVTKGDRRMTFWLYFAFRIMASIALAAVFPLLDSAMIQMTIDHKGDIGLQRMYTLVAYAIWAPVAGILIDKMGIGFSPAFYIYDSLHVISAILAIFMKLNVRLPATDIWTNVGVLLRNPRVVVFIFVVFFIGAAWGLLDSFLFWFMEEDLKSPKWVLGLTSTVGCICGIPVCAGATWIIKRTGHTNILIFSMFVYGIRYIGYSYVYNVYYILPLEGLEAFTNSLMWITATIYASKIAPAYLATLQGIIGGMHYGIGRGAGALFGGLMIRAVGTRQAWFIFSFVCFGCSILYALLHFFWLRKVHMPHKTAAIYKSAEALKQMDIGTAERELKPMDEKEEEMLHQMALLSVRRATSGGSLSGSMSEVRRDDTSIISQKDFDEDIPEEGDEVGYYEQQSLPKNSGYHRVNRTDPSSR